MQYPTNISDHISFLESTYSQTAEEHGVTNLPNKNQLENMIYLAENIFEPLRNLFGEPIRVSSFFRSQAVNILVKGSSNSQHMRGQAIDLQAIAKTGYDNMDLFNWIKDNCSFDQLIQEYPIKGIPQWIHVSLKKEGNNRKQILTIK